jgi:hypothetical protein
VPARHTELGIRAVTKDRPVDPEGVERYLAEKFGTALEDTEKALKALAQSFEPEELAVKAFTLYERFRPEIPSGVRGWGVKGNLDLQLIFNLAKGNLKR